MKLRFAANLVLNWVCSLLSFPELFQPMAAAAICTVAINVLEPGAFNAESQYPHLIKFMTLRRAAKRGWSIKWGCNSAPTGHDFPYNSNIYFLFFTMRTGPFSKCEHRFGSQIGGGSHWEPHWNPTMVFSWRVRKAQNWLDLPRRGRNLPQFARKKNTGLHVWSVQSPCRCCTTSANPHQWPGRLPSIMAPSLAATGSSWQDLFILGDFLHFSTRKTGFLHRTRGSQKVA
jgi:hypothetical protein